MKFFKKIILIILYFILIYDIKAQNITKDSTNKHNLILYMVL